MSLPRKEGFKDFATTAFSALKTMRGRWSKLIQKRAMSFKEDQLRMMHDVNIILIS